jgi:hypothetical protein
MSLYEIPFDRSWPVFVSTIRLPHFIVYCWLGGLANHTHGWVKPSRLTVLIRCSAIMKIDSDPLSITLHW